MILPLNRILFILTYLFGINTNAVFEAEQTYLTLDLESKTATIEYLDLTTPTEDIKYAKKGIKKIDKSKNFGKDFDQLKLTSKSIEKKDGKLNVRVDFSFTDQDELMELLLFNTTTYIEDVPSDVFFYQLLPSEELVSSNGVNRKLEENVVLKWDAETKLIKLELKKKGSREGFPGDTKSISEYWKK